MALVDVIRGRDPAGVAVDEMAAGVMRQVLSALMHLHELGAVVGGLMLDDLRVPPLGRRGDLAVPTVVLVGALLPLVRTQPANIEAWTGYPLTVAPEVLRGDEVGPAADVWSVGVLVYLLITGSYPFAISNYEDLYESILNADYEPLPRQEAKETDLSMRDHAIQFVEQTLVADPASRLSPRDALSHPFLTHAPPPSTRVELEDVPRAAHSEQARPALRATRAAQLVLRASLEVARTEELPATGIQR
ncbi:serine/threonine protein kinase [Thecamonas trahens ATCC 50062]|uniref:Serine/threonine protein kinase n=1 Tax=Thecamonas trahens ATCC 50062 TaxID=461836 RepID=A0A0L0DED5_THETB|nr:serine/threonine protein kinase [Thecamonas trahens ATCC 50062]KNC50692.1 serine/threonine protein kinase [Thecamonas trahens ATCC 50062]|eukprot:XP_013762569.1 serine/threonine protein kinase [Thecamonas trahens ATCC 50062]